MCDNDNIITKNIYKKENFISFLKSQINFYNKSQELIEELQVFLNKVNDKKLDINTTYLTTTESINKHILAIYQSLNNLSNIKIEGRKIINVSNNKFNKEGFIINYIDICIGNKLRKKNLSYYIHSLRIQYDESKNIIKIIINDINNNPEHIGFIGSDTSYINENNYLEKYSKCFNNNLKTQNILRIYNLYYILIFNSVIKILT